jgi:hypothetical protein
MKAILIASIAASLASQALVAAGFHNGGIDWAELPEEARKGLESQVEGFAGNPELTPQAVHAAWLEQKQADGWTFGAQLDADKKVSPNIVPWDDASPQRRVLDTMLYACANALKAVPDADAVGRLSVDSLKGRDAPRPALVAPDGFVMIKYIGRRLTHKDGNYGTGIQWDHPGQSKPVPAAAAAQMLRHPDVYAMGEGPAPEPAVQVVKVSEKELEEQHTQDVRDSINAMRAKAAVSAFIKTNFGQDADESKPLAALKEQAIQLVDQFGVAK